MVEIASKRKRAAIGRGKAKPSLKLKSRKGKPKSKREALLQQKRDMEKERVDFKAEQEAFQQVQKEKIQEMMRRLDLVKQKEDKLKLLAMKYKHVLDLETLKEQLEMRAEILTMEEEKLQEERLRGKMERQMVIKATSHSTEQQDDLREQVVNLEFRMKREREIFAKKELEFKEREKLITIQETRLAQRQKLLEEKEKQLARLQNMLRLLKKSEREKQKRFATQQK